MKASFATAILCFQRWCRCGNNRCGKRLRICG